MASVDSPQSSGGSAGEKTKVLKATGIQSNDGLQRSNTKEYVVDQASINSSDDARRFASTRAHQSVHTLVVCEGPAKEAGRRYPC